MVKNVSFSGWTQYKIVWEFFIEASIVKVTKNNYKGFRGLSAPKAISGWPALRYRPIHNSRNGGSILPGGVKRFGADDKMFHISGGALLHHCQTSTLAAVNEKTHTPLSSMNS